MENKNNNYLIGILGALLGGFIGTIPWVLMYVYANMIYSLLAILVAICALKGYELFKGKVDNKLPYIIAVVSFLSITFATLVVIPNLLILKDLHVLSIANFKLLYETSEFREALLGDYLISLLFTFLGIIGIISNIKRQVNMGNEKIDLNYNPYEVKVSDRERIKSVFSKYNSFDKNNLITKEELFKELENDEANINNLIREGYIKVKSGKYYYNEKREKVSNKKVKNILIITGVILVLFGIGIMLNDDKNTPKVDIETREVIYDTPNGYQEYENDNGGFYYVPNKDLSGKSGFIDVSYYSDGVSYDDYDEVVNNIKTSFESQEYKIKSYDRYKNNKNNEVIVFVLDFDSYEEIIYYVFKDNKYAIIDAFNYYNINNSSISDNTKLIADNFDWKN